MRLPGVLYLFLAAAAPHVASSSRGNAADDAYALGFLLSLLFVPPMFALFVRGCGELFDHWTTRGWREPSKRRPLR